MAKIQRNQKLIAGNYDRLSEEEKRNKKSGWVVSLNILGYIFAAWMLCAIIGSGIDILQKYGILKTNFEIPAFFKIGSGR